jgi:hypothetical protein
MFTEQLHGDKFIEHQHKTPRTLDCGGALCYNTSDYMLQAAGSLAELAQWRDRNCWWASTAGKSVVIGRLKGGARVMVTISDWSPLPRTGSG